MNRLPLAVVAVLVWTCMWGLAAEKLPIEKVSVDGLTAELQKSAEPTDGMNLVWWVPVEFWEATLSQNAALPKADVKALLDELRPYSIVAVLRGNIGIDTPSMFYGEREVGAMLKVTYTDADGKTRTLAPEAVVTGKTQVILDQMRPALAGAMGEAGKNMHFFVYKDQDKDGNRLVSPYVAGHLTLELAALPKDQGGTVTIDFPLDALYKPRECAACRRKALMAWQFCPMCGKQLGK